MENYGSNRENIFKLSEQTLTSKGHSPSNIDVLNHNDQPPF
jgi:hypothetical protein